MYNYLKLMYILRSNYFIALLESLPIGKFNLHKINSKKYAGMKILFLIEQIGKIAMRSIVCQLVYTGLVVVAEMHILKIPISIETFLMYYFPAMLLEQLCLSLSKPHILSAKEYDDCLLRIYKIPSKEVIKTKKILTVFTITLESIICMFGLIGIGVKTLTACEAMLLLVIASIMGNKIIELFVYRYDTIYLKIRVILTVVLFFAGPIVGVLIGYYGNFRNHESVIRVGVEVIVLVILLAFFFKTNNSQKLANIIKKIYQDNYMLLESLDEERATKTKKENISKRKEGYAYLNELFFDRHRKIIWKDFIGKAIVIFFVVIIILAQNVTIKYSQVEVLVSFIPYVLYEFSISKKITRLFYSNCDSNMMMHPFFCDRKAQKVIGRNRLKSIIKENVKYSIGGFFIFALIYHIMWKKPVIGIELIVFLVCFLIMVLHSIFDFYMYYFMKPYTANTKIRTPVVYIYKILYLGILGYICTIVLTFVV